MPGAQKQATSYINKIDNGVLETQYDPENNCFKTSVTDKYPFYKPDITKEHILDSSKLITTGISDFMIHNKNTNMNEIPKVNAVFTAFNKDLLYKLTIPNDFFHDNELKQLYELIMYCCTERIIGQIFSHKEDCVIVNEKRVYVYLDNFWHIDDDEAITSAWLYKRMFNTLTSLKNRLINDNNNSDISDEIKERSANKIEKIIVNIFKSIGNRNILKNAIKTTYTGFTNYNFNLFNNNQILVPFSNGAYHLLNKNLLSHCKEHYITSLIKYEYNPDVNNPEVMKFLTSILPDKKSIRLRFKKTC